MLLLEKFLKTKGEKEEGQTCKHGPAFQNIFMLLTTLSVSFDVSLSGHT